MTRSRIDVSVNGWFTVSAKVRTVEDLHQLSRELMKRGTPGDWVVDYGADRIFIESRDSSMRAEWIECGDHLPDEVTYDVLLLTHDHVGEEVIPQFDWVAKDRYLEANDARPE